MRIEGKGDKEVVGCERPSIDGALAETSVGTAVRAIASWLRLSLSKINWHS